MVTNQLVTIYYTAPADLAHGSYDLGMEIDSISKDYGMVVWEKDATAGTALIVGQETSQPDPKPEDKEEGEKAPIVPTDPEVPKVPITPTQPGKPSAITFKDVAADAYYYAPVTWAVENGITSGTSADTFSPNAPCTRAQAVVFLWRAAGCPQPMSSHMPFTDVAYGSYYHDAVLWAVENGITSGTSATTFGP